MTAVIGDVLAGKNLTPARQYLDSGYLSAELAVSELARHGVALVGPLLADTSAGPGNGYARADFAHKPGRSPARRQTSASWNRCTQRGNTMVPFSVSDCGPCPPVSCAPRVNGGGSRSARGLAEAQAAARPREQGSANYAPRTRRRSPAPGHRAPRATPAKTHLDHVHMACALNVLRLRTVLERHPSRPAASRPPRAPGTRPLGRDPRLKPADQP